MEKVFFMLVAGTLAISASSISANESAETTLGRPIPFEILDPPWLEARQQAQLKTRPEFGVPIDFSFTDQQESSGILFRNRVVEDAGITYKAVHYDHGNGVAVADVDNDGLYDLYFTNQVGANELWRNNGDGRFENITNSSGTAVIDRISVAASFADIDNDGDADLYVTTVRQGNLLFENQGNGQFRDITAASGLGHKGHSSGAVFFDFDRDGLVDVYLTNVGQYTSSTMRVGRHEGTTYRFFDGLSDAFGGHHFEGRTEKNLLFRNLGDNRFEDATEIMKGAITGWSGDATAMDVNQDGWPDLYVLNMQGNDQYYENQAGEAFVLKSREVFPKTSWGAMGIKAFDWNNDGRLDIYITDMHSDMSRDATVDEEHLKSDMQWNEDHLKTQGQSIFGNTFFQQTDSGAFEEVSDGIGAENYWPWGLSVGDVNADGWQDVFVTLSMNYPFRYQTNQLLINDQGQKLRPAEFITGIEPRKENETARPWFDLNCGPGDSQHRLCKGANGHVQVWGALGSRSSVIFDLDNDGDLDIVTNEFNSEPLVLMNDLAGSGRRLNYLRIKLQGSRSNHAGIGARVMIKAGTSRYVQVLDGKSGYLSQSQKPLYFGLGQNTSVDEIQVNWPSGKVQTLSPDGINRLITIQETP